MLLPKYDSFSELQFGWKVLNMDRKNILLRNDEQIVLDVREG